LPASERPSLWPKGGQEGFDCKAIQRPQIHPVPPLQKFTKGGNDAVHEFACTVDSFTEHLQLSFQLLLVMAVIMFLLFVLTLFIFVSMMAMMRMPAMAAHATTVAAVHKKHKQREKYNRY
jgi:hypothetical protein